MWQLLGINCVTPVPSTKAMLPAPGPISPVEHPQGIAVHSFFSLPRELRDLIYHLVLGEEEEYYCQSRRCLAWGQDMDFNTFMYREILLPTCNRISIACTCRIANEEANPVIYRNNKFSFYVIRPRISQKNAHIVQTFHIILGSNGISMTRSVQF